VEAVLVAFPAKCQSYGIPVEAIREMAEDVLVTTLVANATLESMARDVLMEYNVNMDNCNFVLDPAEVLWTRDYGPWYIHLNEEIEGIVNFRYNHIAYPLADDVPITMSEVLGLDLYGMDLMHVGGNYMCDGYGIGSSTDMIYSQNYQLTQGELNSTMLDYLGIHTYYTVPDAQGLIGHIDCFAKFLDVDKVLVGQVPETDPRYDQYEFTADYFAGRTSSYGNTYQVYRVYTPGTGFGIPPSDDFITPYTNSLILNNKVFVPITGCEFDDAALAVYAEAMPGYEIISVLSTAMGLLGFQNIDAIHCRAKGIPDPGMLYIEHFPLLGIQDHSDQYLITARFLALSGAAIPAENLMVQYQVNDVGFQDLAMEVMDPETGLYGANLPGGAGDYDYIISAVDASGRHASHPIIGLADPHSFWVLYLTGDVNDDGNLDVLDIVNIVNFILGYSVPNDLQFIAADLSGDDVLNVLDIIQLLNLIIG